MASAVDSRLAYARLSAVATASRLPTANRGSNNSYTTSWDTTPFQTRALITELSKTSASNGIILSVCSQPENVVVGVGIARCIDAGRLSRMGARNAPALVKGNRPGCMCHVSRDIGAYNTCPHGCVYCYAVDSRDQAKLHHS